MSSFRYDYIHDPVSNKLIKSDSKKGKQIINNYIHEFNGGGLMNTLIEYVSSSKTKPPSPHTKNYGQFLVYVLPEQLNRRSLITHKFLTFEEYLYYKISNGYLLNLAKLFKYFVTHILQLKLIQYYENKNLKYSKKKHNEVVRNIYDISDIIHSSDIKYDIFSDTDINSIFRNKYNSLLKSKFKVKNELEILNLEPNENSQITLALDAINQIKIFMTKSLLGIEKLLANFREQYEIKGIQNFNKYRQNHAVRKLEAQKYNEKYPDGSYDILKFSQEWDETARDNIAKLVGENQQPVCVTYNKEEDKYDLTTDYKNCFDKVENFLNKLEKDSAKIEDIYNKLVESIDTEQAVYSRKIFKDKNFDNIYR